ncbi:MAG TPA: ABC transporter substrate-binding protein, partial [Solirubrobacteraceae bacterium]
MSVLRKCLSAGLALGAVTLVAACGSSSNSGGGGSSGGSGPITIGTSLSLSGDFSADGQAFERGYQLWVADQNKAGGLLGRKVKLDVLSDASSPAQVVSNYQKL